MSKVSRPTCADTKLYQIVAKRHLNPEAPLFWSISIKATGQFPRSISGVMSRMPLNRRSYASTVAATTNQSEIGNKRSAGARWAPRSTITLDNPRNLPIDLDVELIIRGIGNRLRRTSTSPEGNNVVDPFNWPGSYCAQELEVSVLMYVQEPSCAHHAFLSSDTVLCK